MRHSTKSRNAAVRLVCALGITASGCGEAVYVGSDILWSARHETGDLSEWSSDGLGGEQMERADDTITVSSERAYSGRFSAKLTRTVSEGSSRGGGPLLARLGGLPEEAYYSAWFFIPEPYSLASGWTIFKFDVQTSDQPVYDRGIELQLRSVPFGGYVLEVLFHNEAYLRAPLANPPAEVASGRWFHVEAEFRAVADATGYCVVWLDGRRVYDLQARPTIAMASNGFMASSLFSESQPGIVELFIDDVVISRVRATPEGRFEP